MKMRSEATDVKSTLLEIEDWLDKLMQLTEEVDLGITQMSFAPRRILWLAARVGWVDGASGMMFGNVNGSDQ